MAPNLNPTEANLENGSKGGALPKLPVIDLSGLDGPGHDEVVEAIVKASEKFGFFLAVNHGLSVEFLEELKDAVHRIHGEPEEKKAAYLKEVSPSPNITYVPHTEIEKLDHFILFYTDDEDAMTYWPDCCKETVIKYFKTTNALIERLLRILMSDLGVTLDEEMIDAYLGVKFVLMNYYPPRSHLASTTPGTLKHTDLGTLTALLQDDVGGLFMKLREDGDMENNYKGEWVEIKPIPGSLLMFVGDSMQVLSNGKYISPEHTVVPPTSGATRISFPSFTMPKQTTKMGPVPQMVERSGGKPRYKEFMFSEYNEYALTLINVEKNPIESFEMI